MYNRSISPLLVASFLVCGHFLVAVNARCPYLAAQNDQIAPPSNELDLNALHPTSGFLQSIMAIVNSLPKDTLEHFCLNKHAHDDAGSDAHVDALPSEDINTILAPRSEEEHAKMIERRMVALPTIEENPMDVTDVSSVEPEMSTYDPTSMSVMERARLMDANKWGSGFDSTQGTMDLQTKPASVEIVNKLIEKFKNMQPGSELSPGIVNPVDVAASSVVPGMSTYDPTSLSVIERARLMDASKWGSGFDSTEGTKPTEPKTIDLPSNLGSVAQLANMILSGKMNIPGLSEETQPTKIVKTAPAKEESSALWSEKPGRLSSSSFAPTKPASVASVKQLIGKFENIQAGSELSPGKPIVLPGKERLPVKTVVDMIENGDMGNPAMRR